MLNMKKALTITLVCSSLFFSFNQSAYAVATGEVSEATRFEQLLQNDLKKKDKALVGFQNTGTNAFTQHYQLARHYHSKKLWALALQEYKAAAEHVTQVGIEYNIYKYMATCNLKMKLYAGCFDSVQKANQMGLSQMMYEKDELYYLMARAQTDLGNYDYALELAQEAFELRDYLFKNYSNPYGKHPSDQPSYRHYDLHILRARIYEKYWKALMKTDFVKANRCYSMYMQDSKQAMAIARREIGLTPAGYLVYNREWGL